MIIIFLMWNNLLSLIVMMSVIILEGVVLNIVYI